MFLKQTCLRLILLLTISFIVLRPHNSDACKVAGGEAYFYWVSDSTYNFTCVLYRHVIPSSNMPYTLQIVGNSQSTGKIFFSSLPRMALGGPGTPSLTPNNILNCRDSSNLSIEEYVYRGDVTIPSKARDWRFSLTGSPFYPNPCFVLSNEYDNLSDTGRPNVMDLLIGINNLDFPDSVSKSISPVWHTRRPNIPGFQNDTLNKPGVMSLCEGRNYILDQSVKEYQGDRVKYELYFNNSVALKSPFYSKSYPLPTKSFPSFSIDSMLGTIPYNPTAPSHSFGSMKLYHIAIKASEFRMDTDLIGGSYVPIEKEISFLIRHMTLAITDSANCPDSNFLFADTINHLPTSSYDINCWDNPIKLSFTFPILCNSVDSNGTCFVLKNSINGDTLNITKAESFCGNNIVNDYVKIYFDTVLDPGLYYLYVKKGDDGNTILSQCGSEIAPSGDSVEIYVNTGPNEPAFQNDSLGLNTDYLEPECRAWEMNVFTSYPIRCNSAILDGKEFYLVDSSSTPINKVAIKRVSKVNCINGFTSNLIIHFTNPIESGLYKLYLKEGSDGNTVIDACHRKWPFISIDVKVPELAVDLGNDIEICSRDEVNVTLSITPGLSYRWNTGDYVNSINVTDFGTYWVQAWTNTGCTNSDTIRIIEKICTGIDENDQTNFKIYPNPTNGTFFLKAPKYFKGELRIQNTLGNLVYKTSIVKVDYVQINLPSSIENGIYIIKFESQAGILTKKIVVQRE